MADDNLTRIIRVQIDASQAYGVTEKFNKNVENMSNSLKKLQDGFSLVAKGWATLKSLSAGWEGIKGIVKASDELKQLQATFEVLMPAGQNSVAMMKDLTGIAMTLGTSLEDTTKVAQRFAVALGSVGATNEQVAQLTENVMMLGRIGGASMADTTEGARQLGQAFASGKLQGDELRSIMERIPLVGQKIAETMKVATGQLYKLGADGKITTDILFKSLLSDTEKIKEQFAKLPFTFEQSMNRLQTSWTLFLASFEKVSGLGQTVTTVFVYLGSLITYITEQLSVAGEETNGWKTAAIALGNAFKGIIIVVSALATGIAQVATSAYTMFNAFRKAASGDFMGAWDEIKDGIKSVTDQGKTWMTFADDIAMGTTSIGKSAKETRDFMKDWEAVLKKLQNGMDKTGKKSKEAASEIEKFKKSLSDMFEKSSLVPAKLELIQKAMDSVNTSTEEGAKLWLDLRNMYEEMREPSAAIKAFREIDKSIDELTGKEDTLFALQEKLMELQEVGAEGTKEWIAYKKAYDDLMISMDDTGMLKAVQDVKDMVKEAENMQKQFDAVNAAVERGDIPAAWAENWKNSILQVSKETKKVKTDLEELVTEFGKMSKKFTSEFADKLVDNIGKVDAAWGDFVEDFLKSIAKIMLNAMFQKFIKTMATMGAQSGGMWGSFFQAILGSAKGNAWNANGVQFMAQGGILNSPTYFNNSGRLAVAGEAGPEAVVPLQRTSSGDLGVAASPVNIVINNTQADNVDVKASATDNADGSKQITIFVEQKVRSMFSSGQMDRTMSSSYGLVRQAR